jgi:hypothetical protein
MEPREVGCAAYGNTKWTTEAVKFPRNFMFRNPEPKANLEERNETTPIRSDVKWLLVQVRGD